MLKNQVSKGSTSKAIKYRLDEISLSDLWDVMDTFNKINQPFTQSVIVRRALRLYQDRIEAMKMKGRNDLIDEEVNQLNRARKGQ